MTITARAKIQFSSNTLFSDPEFRNKLEHHIDILASRAASIAPPSLLDQETNRGDFRMVLRQIVVPLHMHWLNMRINGIVDVSNWDYLKTGLKLIDEADAVLKGLITLHLTNKK